MPHAAPTRRQLIAACRALADGRAPSFLRAVRVEAPSAARVNEFAPLLVGDLEALRESISTGADPLGEAFLSSRSSSWRRAMGAVFTPFSIVQAMVDWVAGQGRPVRVVDPGAGSGRFILAAAKAFPTARLIAIERDPLAALTLRANLVAHGYRERAVIGIRDYRLQRLRPIHGMTAFIGNPPYVRHHELTRASKRWFTRGCADLGIRASARAGLHLHFFLKTCLLARPGDLGAFITSAEWLDVDYGAALRRLLLDRLGIISLHVFKSTAEPFAGSATTAAIVCFRVGERRPSVRMRSIRSMTESGGLDHGRRITRKRLEGCARWSQLLNPARKDAGRWELGELFNVHRGQVTGANDIWVDGPHAAMLPPLVKFAAVTRARELIRAGARLSSAQHLRRVIDLPRDLDAVDAGQRRDILAFLRWAQAHGADQTYIAQHRTPWWSVRLASPAPILCTYMARRPPQFTVNACQAHHINVAHGLYPRDPLTEIEMAALVRWLNTNVSVASGRTYAGGLTKFEPGEIRRLRVPELASLRTGSNQSLS